MAEVASAFVSIVPTAKGFGSKLSRELSGPTQKAGSDGGKKYASGMSGSLKGAGKTIFAPLAAAAAAIGIKNFLGDAIGEARESQKVGALTAQVIKTTGSAAKVTAGQVGELSTAISNKTGIDDEAIQSASNLLLTFTNVRNEVGKGNDVFNQATQAATDMGAALGTEPKAAAIQLGKALNDPVKGVTALSRVGVSFTKQQKDQIKTLVKSGDTLGAQKIVLGELKKEFGGAAAASATSGEKLSVAFGNFKETIGTALLPVIDKVASALTKTVIPAAQQVFGVLFAGDFTGGPFSEDSKIVDILFRVRDGIKTVAGVAKQAFDILFRGDFTHGPLSEDGKFTDVLFRVRDGLVDVVDRVKEFVAQFAAGEGAGGRFRDVLTKVVDAAKATAVWIAKNRDVLIPLAGVVASMVAAYKAFIAVTKIAAAVQGALNIVMTLNPIGIVIALIAGLVIGLVIAYKRSDKFRTVVQAAFHGISTAASFMWNKVLKPTFRFITDAFLTVAGVIIHAAADAFGWVPGIGPKLKTAAKKFDEFRDNVNRALNGITDKTVSVTIKSTATGRNIRVIDPSKLATGGSVFGAGTGTSDSIPAMLSNGEHVWTAAEVRNAGGHETVERLRQLAKRGALPRFAGGGRVIDITGRETGLTAAQSRVSAVAKQLAAEQRLDGLGAINGGNGKGSAGSMRAFGLLLRRMGYSVTEGPPPFGPVHRVHAPNSRHYSGRAIDVNHGAGTSALEQAYLRKIIPLGHSYGLSSIFMRPGHYNHAHFQYDQGGWLQPGRTMVENKTGKPEAVFNQEQLAALTSGRGGVTITGDIYNSSPRKVVRDVIQEQKRHDALNAVYSY